MEDHYAASKPLIKAQTVNATATVTGDWYRVGKGMAFGLWAYHASATGTGDVTYYVDLFFKPGNPNSDTVTTSDYYRVTLGNIAADTTPAQYIPDELDAPFRYIRGVATGQAANPADTVAYLYMTQW